MAPSSNPSFFVFPSSTSLPPPPPPAVSSSMSPLPPPPSSTFPPPQISRLLPPAENISCGGQQLENLQQFLYPTLTHKELQQMLDQVAEVGIGGTIDEGMSKNYTKKKQQRLEVDQVRLLERSFKEERKLEPERKLQIAEQLGLEPRQVAIWFQNRRARSKNKQLEKDYAILKALYHATILEKQKLQHEVIHLKKELKELGYIDDRTYKDKQLQNVDGNSNMGIAKYIEQQEASRHADDSRGIDEESKSLPGKTDIAMQRDFENFNQEDIVLSTTRVLDDSVLQPNCGILVDSNLTHVSNTDHIAEGYQHLTYANQHFIDDNNHHIKLNYTLHDIWRD